MSMSLTESVVEDAARCEALLSKIISGELRVKDEGRILGRKSV